MEYAGFWKRFTAFLIDWTLVLIVSVIISVIIEVIIGRMLADSVETERMANNIEAIGRIIIFWVYYATMESSSKQATLGKMALGIKVTDTDGNPISFDKASGRFFGKGISTLILGIGFVMAAFTAKKQTLHDMMAGCLVINSDDFKSLW